MVKTSTTPQEQDEIGLIHEYIQLWKNKGFDFDDPPSTYLTKEDSCDDFYCEKRRLKDLVNKINAQVKMQHEELELELEEALKIVYAKKQLFWIKKFNVREFHSNVVKTVEAFVNKGPAHPDLIEWRFKDGPPETPPPQGRGQIPCPEIAPEDTPRPSIPPPSRRPTYKVNPFPETCEAPFPAGSFKTCVDEVPPPEDQFLSPLDYTCGPSSPPSCSRVSDFYEIEGFDEESFEWSSDGEALNDNYELVDGWVRPDY